MKAMHILALALMLTVVVAGLALAQAGVERPREVLAGGASDATTPGVTLRATLGQPVVGGISAGEEIALGQGFWHGGVLYGERHIYLPLVVRNDS